MNIAERKYLRSKAHSLKPVVIVGNNGVTDAVQAEIANALEHHELIKIRVSQKDRDVRKTMGEEIIASQKAELIQSIGHIITIYKKRAK